MQKNRRINNEAHMLGFGAELAQNLRAGDILAMSGDLGAGKTTLSRGIVQAICGQTDVPSPTYTLVQIYGGPDFDIQHCDLYRLKHPDEIYELGIFDMMETAVTLIEWPERMGELLPVDAVKIDIRFDAEAREIDFRGPDDVVERLLS